MNDKEKIAAIRKRLIGMISLETTDDWERGYRTSAFELVEAFFPKDKTPGTRKRRKLYGRPIEKMTALELRAIWEVCCVCGSGTIYCQEAFCPECGEVTHVSCAAGPELSTSKKKISPPAGMVASKRKLIRRIREHKEELDAEIERLFAEGYKPEDLELVEEQRAYPGRAVLTTTIRLRKESRARRIARQIQKRVKKRGNG